MWSLRGIGQLIALLVYVLIEVFAFSALTLLVGRQEEHLACKTCVMRCWCEDLSGARCRLFVYGPVDATAILKPCHLLLRLNPDWLYLCGTSLPRLSWKKLLSGCCSRLVVVVVVVVHVVVCTD